MQSSELWLPYAFAGAMLIGILWFLIIAVSELILPALRGKKRADGTWETEPYFYKRFERWRNE